MRTDGLALGSVDKRCGAGDEALGRWRERRQPPERHEIGGRTSDVDLRKWKNIDDGWSIGSPPGILSHALKRCNCRGSPNPSSSLVLAVENLKTWFGLISVAEEGCRTFP